MSGSSLREWRENHREEEARIARARDVLQPTPVRLSHLPRWMIKAIRSNIRIPKRMPNSGLHDYLPDRSKWLDHWGTTTFEGTKFVFVTEPYPNPDQYRLVCSIAKRLGAGRCFMSANSHWNPGYTVRYLLFPPESKEVSSGING